MEILEARMNILKKSFFSFALSSIVLLASVSPVECAKHVLKPVVAPVLIESIPVKSKKRQLSFKQKLRKKFKKIKNGISEFVEEHPVATVSSVLGTIALWFFWDKIFTPWTRVPNAVGASACDVQQAVIAQGVSPIHFGGEVPDVRFNLNQPVQVVQLRCAEQVGPECAYHAIKNAIVVVNELVGQRGDLQTWLEDDVVLAKDLFGLNNQNGQHGAWRQRVLAQRAAGRIPAGECDADGNWLRGDAVQNIIDHEIAARGLLAGNIVVNGNNAANGVHITVIEDAAMIGNPILDPTQAARNNLQAVERNNLQAPVDVYTHAFIFNTARAGIGLNGMPFVPARGGHWLPAVLHRDAQGVIRWYVANSQYQRLIFDWEPFRNLVAAVQGVQVPNAPAPDAPQVD
jgi:hypothetical protein